jgi:uncharacterized protein YqeY
MRPGLYLWTILFFLLPVVAYSQTVGDPLVGELYVKSGLARQTEELPSMMQAVMDRHFFEDDSRLSKLPDKVRSFMKSSISRAFAPDRLKEVMLAELSRNLSDQDIKEELQWFDSPLGKKCTQLEEDASTAAAQVEMLEFAAKINNLPPADKRLKALRELDSAAKITQSALEIAIDTQAAFALGMIATLPLEQQRRPEDVARDLEETRPEIEATVRSEMFIADLYTYRSLSDSEIQQYTEFAKSPAGSRFNQVCTAALRKAMNEGAVTWGKLIGDALKELDAGFEA